MPARKDTQILIRLDEEAARKLDGIASAADVSRTRAAREILLRAIDEDEGARTARAFATLTKQIVISVEGMSSTLETTTSQLYSLTSRIYKIERALGIRNE